MAQDDLYKTLGISRSASSSEIKKAYRKLSKEFHPDKNVGDKRAAEQFKAVQDAYSVLSDDDKRAHYDRFGTAQTGARGGNPFGGGGNPFGGGGPGGPQGAGPIDLGDIFGSFFGGGGGNAGFGGGQQPQQRPQKGENIKLEIEVPFQVAAEGGEHVLNLTRNGKRESISIKVPAGIEFGKSIRLAGQGNPGVGGGPHGDLMVTVKYCAHPYFRREGQSLYLDLPLTPAEAVLGTKVEVPTLSEGEVVMTIPPGTSTGAKLRLREKGVLNLKTKKRGDQFVVVKIVVPKEVTSQTQELYEQLKEIESDDPRAEIWN